MKFIVVGLSIITVMLVISQVWAKKTSSDIEMYPYEVVQKYDDFEIRNYESANFIYTSMNKNTYKETSGSGFRTLAGYIFGGNSENQKIAMTSPVEIEMKDSVTMKFMIPSEYDMKDMPTPNNSNVKFKTEPSKTVAAITFGGWANDERIAAYTARLKSLLEKEGIQHNDRFSFLGYNSPFELVGRKNEIVVEVLIEDLQK